MKFFRAVKEFTVDYDKVFKNQVFAVDIAFELPKPDDWNHGDKLEIYYQQVAEF